MFKVKNEWADAKHKIYLMAIFAEYIAIYICEITRHRRFVNFLIKCPPHLKKISQENNRQRQ